MSYRLSTSLDARTLGLVGDGNTDNTAALQAAFNRLDVTKESRLVIPSGVYVISDELVFTNKRFITIEGEPGTTILWRGSDVTGSKSILRLKGCYGFNFKNLTFMVAPKWTANVITEYSATAAITCETNSGGASGRHTFENLVIDGHMPIDSLDTGGFYLVNGIEFSTGSGNNFNNDHCIFKNVKIVFTAGAAVAINHSSSIGHRFYGCLFDSGTFGIDSIGCFQWFGGSVSGSRIACFRQIHGSGLYDICLIEGVTCEESARLFISYTPPDTTVITGTLPVTLRNCQFNLNRCPLDGTQHKDGGAADYTTDGLVAADLDGSGGNGTVGVTYPIWFNFRGPIVIDNCRFIGIMANGARRVRFKLRGYGGMSATVTNNVIATDNPLVNPIDDYSNANDTNLLFTNNVGYVWTQDPASAVSNTTGIPTYSPYEQWFPNHQNVSKNGGRMMSYAAETRVQQPAFSATPTFDAKNGEFIIYNMTGNVTSWTLVSPDIEDSDTTGGQMLTICFVQDATGNRTLSGGIGGYLGNSGQLTLSTSPNAVDVLTFRWDTVAEKWREISRVIRDQTSSGVATTGLQDFGTGTRRTGNFFIKAPGAAVSDNTVASTALPFTSIGMNGTGGGSHFDSCVISPAMPVTGSRPWAPMKTAAATSGRYAGIALMNDNGNETMRQYGPIWTGVIKTDSSITNTRIWFVMANSAPNAMNAISPATSGTNAKHWAAVAFDSAVSAKWRISSGDGTNYSSADVSDAPNVAANTEYILQVDLSVAGTLTVRVTVGGPGGTTYEASKTTNLPGATTGLGCAVMIVTLAAENKTIYVSRGSLSMN